MTLGGLALFNPSKVPKGGMSVFACICLASLTHWRSSAARPFAAHTFETGAEIANESFNARDLVAGNAVARLA